MVDQTRVSHIEDAVRQAKRVAFDAFPATDGLLSYEESRNALRLETFRLVLTSLLGLERSHS